MSGGVMAFTTGSAEWRAGATDVQDRRHRGVTVGPVRDIEPTPDRTTLGWLPDGGVRIGSLVRVEKVAADPAIRAAYRGLAAAAGGLATPQVRAVATVGGALAQRSRCWYSVSRSSAASRKAATRVRRVRAITVWAC